MTDYDPNEHNVSEDEKPIFHEAEFTETMGNVPLDEDVAMKLAEEGMNKNPLAMKALRAQKHAAKVKALRGKLMKSPDKKLPSTPLPKEKSGPKTPDLTDM